MTTTDLGVTGVTWNLADLYARPDDSALEHDLTTALARAQAFAARYRGTINVPGGPTAQWLADAVVELESILEQADQPGAYAGLLHAADSRPPAHGALVALTQERGTEIRNQLLFFDLEWIALDEALAGPIIDAPACARYRHFLASLRRYRPHTLSEPEEKLLEETANTGRRAFSRLFDEVLAKMTFEVEVDGERRTLNESAVLALLYEPERALRQRAARALTDGLRSQSLLLTFIFNVIAQDHAQSDRLRRYPDPMAARHLANDIEPATVEVLMTTCEDHADVVRTYYHLKQRLLGLDALYDYDRYAPIDGDAETVTWAAARELVLEAYGDFSPRLREIAAQFFTQRWIDAEVRDGKRGGAFSASTVPRAHPYVLLNYLGHPRDVQTLAHELGHGAHQYLARPRGYLQSDTALTMAETASVFGEMLVFDRLRRQERRAARAPGAALRVHRGSVRHGLSPDRADPLRATPARRAAARGRAVERAHRRALAGGRTPYCTAIPSFSPTITAGGGRTSRTSSTRRSIATPTASASCWCWRCTSSIASAATPSSLNIWICWPPAAARRRQRCSLASTSTFETRASGSAVSACCVGWSTRPRSWPTRCDALECCGLLWSAAACCRFGVGGVGWVRPARRSHPRAVASHRTPKRQQAAALQSRPPKA